MGVRVEAVRSAMWAWICVVVVLGLVERLVSVGAVDWHSCDFIGRYTRYSAVGFPACIIFLGVANIALKAGIPLNPDTGTGGKALLGEGFLLAPGRVGESKAL